MGRQSTKPYIDTGIGKVGMKWRSVERAPEWYNWQPLLPWPCVCVRACIAIRMHVNRSSCTFALLSSTKNVCKEVTKSRMRQEKECSVVCECESRTVVLTQARAAQIHRSDTVNYYYYASWSFIFLSKCNRYTFPTIASNENVISICTIYWNAMKKAVDRKTRDERRDIESGCWISFDWKEKCASNFFWNCIRSFSVLTQIQVGAHCIHWRAHTGAHGEQMFAIVLTILAMVFVNHQLDSLAAQQVLNVVLVCGLFFTSLRFRFFFLPFWTLRWTLVYVVTCVSAPHFCCDSCVRWGMLHLRWKSIYVRITGALIY